jgi:phosphate transport system protein
MTEHTVAAFDDDLNAVDRLIREMGDLAAAMVGAATRALLDLDNPLAHNVVSRDAVMDAMQRDLDERAITLIARRQPVAGDLRSVVGAIRMAADLERIGDLAKNIAKRVGAVGEAVPPRRFAHGIDAMTDLVLEQVEGVIREYG